MEPLKPSASQPPFGALLEEEIPMLRRYARSLTLNSSRGDADDLLQDTLIRAWGKRHLFRAGTNLEAWLVTIMRNQRANDLRTSARRNEQIGIDPVLLKGIGDARVDSAAGVILRDLVRVLEKLPAERRRAIGLIGYYGLSYDEAAAHERIPGGTIRSRLFRGRQELLREIRE